MKTRCKTGCLTCRRRRKKCDESSFPLCKNCVHNLLKCIWPENVLKSKKEKIRALNSPPETQNEVEELSKTDPSPSLLELGSSEQPFQQSSLELLLRQVSSNIIPKTQTERKEEKRENFILHRIAMQQDCVDDEVTLEVPPIRDTKKDIRSRIWNQLDVLDDRDYSSLPEKIDILDQRGSPSPVNI